MALELKDEWYENEGLWQFHIVKCFQNEDGEVADEEHIAFIIRELTPSIEKQEAEIKRLKAVIEDVKPKKDMKDFINWATDGGLNMREKENQEVIRTLRTANKLRNG